MKEEFTPSHPYAEIFPLHIEGQSFADFAVDLKENGLREKIVMHQGKVLDGRRRERGCRRAGIVPRYVQFKGDDAAALAFVISVNLHRRHLGEGERALIAGKIATAKRGSNPAKSGITTIAEAAKTMDVGEASAERGKKVATKGTPVLQAAVAEGTISITKAAEIASEPPEVQDKKVRELVSKPPPKAKPAPKPKSGSSKFNQAKFDDNYRKLIQFIDTTASGNGKGSTPPPKSLALKGNCHDICIQLMSEILATYKIWKT